MKQGEIETNVIMNDRMKQRRMDGSREGWQAGTRVRKEGENE